MQVLDQTKPHNPQINRRRESGATIPTGYYLDERVLAAERHRIFRSTWQYVGHVSMAAQPGDYFCAEVVGASLLVVRDQDGELRGFYNACQHRGHMLKDESGRCFTIVCPYHAWVYNLDGSLRNAPRAMDLNGFDPEKASLRAIRLENFHGLLFVSNDPAATPLIDMAPDLSREVGKCAPRLAGLHHVHRAEFNIRANWKISVENFLECYHCSLVHKSLVASRDLQSYTVNTHSMWSSQHSVEAPEVNSAWDMSHTEDRETVSWFLWPNLCIIKHPGGDRLITLSLRIRNHHKTVQVADFYLAEPEPDKAQTDYIDFHLSNVRAEDREVIEGVWRGMNSGGLRDGGQLIVGYPDDGPYTEHAVAHFRDVYLSNMGGYSLADQ